MSTRKSFFTSTIYLYFMKQTLERCEYFCRRQTGCGLFRYDVYVEIGFEPFSIVSEVLAKQPFDPTPSNCIPNPFGNSDAKARSFMTTRTIQYDGVCVLYPVPLV